MYISDILFYVLLLVRLCFMSVRLCFMHFAGENVFSKYDSVCFVCQ